MINRQRRLFKRLKKDFYTTKELMDTLDMPYQEAKEATKNLTKFSDGYRKVDIVISLMGGELHQTL